MHHLLYRLYTSTNAREQCSVYIVMIAMEISSERPLNIPQVINGGTEQDPVHRECSSLRRSHSTEVESASYLGPQGQINQPLARHSRDAMAASAVDQLLLESLNHIDTIRID